jgi:hypothetical protein
MHSQEGGGVTSWRVRFEVSSNGAPEDVRFGSARIRELVRLEAEGQKEDCHDLCVVSLLAVSLRGLAPPREREAQVGPHAGVSIHRASDAIIHLFRLASLRPGTLELGVVRRGRGLLPLTLC